MSIIYASQHPHLTVQELSHSLHNLLDTSMVLMLHWEASSTVLDFVIQIRHHDFPGFTWKMKSNPLFIELAYEKLIRHFLKK